MLRCGIASSLMILLRIEAARLAAKLEGVARPERGVATIGIEIPTFAPRGPDGALHPLLHFCIECFLNLGSHLYDPQVSPIHRAHAVQDVVELRLDHEDHGIVPQASVWTYEQEQIGKPRDGRPEISA